MEKRSSSRIAVGLSGHIDWRKLKIPIQVENISAGGACLSMNSEHFVKIGKSEELEGFIEFRKDTIPFRGSVCWSSVAAEQSQVGISFASGQPVLTTLVLNFQPEDDHGPQDGSFFV